MLEYTLATEFVPGTNVRGEVTGANWTFLLPGLDLGQVICWGEPPTAARRALERLAQRVTVCDPATSGPWPYADSSADLVYLADGTGLERLRDEHFRREIARILTPRGRVYVEHRGRLASTQIAADALLGDSLRLWLTPLTGEMHTAVPVEDEGTRRFFLQRGLISPSVTVHTFKDALRAVRGRVTAAARPAPEAVGGSDGKPGGSAAKGFARAAGRLALAGITRAETALHAQSGRIGRYGLLIPPAGAAPEPGPPTYLRDLGAGAGLNLAAYRWGLWAGGQYSSRKVLFFLFEGDQPAPRYLVKMVRAAHFNARLENETQALRRLEALGVENEDGLPPRVVFDGHEHGLALVAETVIDGAPFEKSALYTPDCPYARAAVAWLTALGETSARSQRTPSAEPARVTAELLRRFQSVYDLSEAEYAFLASQVEALGRVVRGFPVVFQHGDPGTWNMLVTSAGRVGVLDWESAEPQGMPLWDVLHFWRAYVVLASRAAGEHDTLRGYARHFLDESAFSPVLIDSIRRYTERVGLAPEAVEPLYYTCWMHRALKQATTLPRSKLPQGYYFRLLRQSIEQRAAPTLGKLFNL